VVLVATASALDVDMAQRIDAHRADRPDWPTIEEPTDLIGALRSVPDGVFVIVDCLTLWVSNLMWAGRTDDEVDELAADAATVAVSLATPVVVVTNEVGMGVHPDTPLGRRYRDVLGRANQAWAASADDALLMMAGRALRLDEPVELLGGTR
jgi:adenosyl cobinamide kinase/adenosyl cobinamide phosphate guanylyltransferase